MSFAVRLPMIRGPKPAVRALFVCPKHTRRAAYRPAGECSIAQERDDRRNDQITAARVRVIGADGEQVGVMMTRDAIAKAADLDLDLVEVSPNADPPVCKIMDYGKYLYQKDKAQHAAKRKQKQIEVKEVKFRPNTEDFGVS